MKFILYGDGENDPQPDQVAQLAQEVYNNDLLQLLVQNIWRFEFEVSHIAVCLVTSTNALLDAGKEGCFTDL